MKVRAWDFFNGAEKEKIRQAVQAAEQNSCGEIAVVLVNESDRYREAELAGSLCLSALLSLVLAIVFRHVTIWFYIPVTVLFLFPFLYLFGKFPHMKLAFLHHRRVEAAVRERAVYTFFQRGVYKTEERTGILIFISLLERKVWILGDEGIHGKIRADFWRSLTRELAGGIKEDRAFDALCHVIAQCGNELARHFPGKAGRKNQLDDNLIC